MTMIIITEEVEGIVDQPELFFTESEAFNRYEELVTTNGFRKPNEGETLEDYEKAYIDAGYENQLNEDTNDYCLHMYKASVPSVKIRVEVRGGNVEAIHCNFPASHVDAGVIDYDNLSGTNEKSEHFKSRVLKVN